MFKVKAIIPDIKAIEKDMINAIKQELEGKIKHITCPKHQEHPQVVVSGPIKNLKIEIKGCCQDLLDQTTKFLNSSE